MHREQGSAGRLSQQDRTCAQFITRPTRPVGRDGDISPALDETDELTHGLGATPRAGATHRAHAEFIHDLGENFAIAAWAGQYGHPFALRVGIAAEKGEGDCEDTIMPEAQDEGPFWHAFTETDPVIYF